MFSIVIPLYNKAKSLRGTIQSVLNQTFHDFEVLVVNDGSTDESVAILQEFTDQRIRLISQRNQGVSAARNTGIKNATFDWIAFLDGDDVWKEDHLEQIVAMMSVFPKECVYVTSFEFSDKRVMFRHSRTSSIFVVDDYFREALHELLIWTSIVVVNKKCFYEVGFFNPSLNRGEDLDVWARLGRKYKIVKNTAITAIYQVGNDNSLSAGKSTYEKSILSVIDLRGLKGFERIYYKKMLLNRIKRNVKELDLIEIFRLLIKHNFQLVI